MASNLFFEVLVTFLNAPLEAKLFKKDKDMLLMVEPQETENAGKVDIKELLDKLKNNGSEVISSAFDKPAGVSLQLSMAYLKYLHMENSNVIEDVEVQDPIQGDSSLKYALKIQVFDIDSLPIFKTIGDIITVKEVTLAVWNTDDASVIEKMNLHLPEFTSETLLQLENKESAQM